MYQDLLLKSLEYGVVKISQYKFVKYVGTRNDFFYRVCEKTGVVI